MQILLPIFNFICMFASVLYIIRHARAKLTWFLGILAVALLSIFSPKLMEFFGNATLTIYVVLATGLVIFLFVVVSVVLSSAPIPQEAKTHIDETENMRASHTQIRYLYGSVRADMKSNVHEGWNEKNERDAWDEQETSIADSLGDVQAPERKRGLAVRFVAWGAEKAINKRKTGQIEVLAEGRNLSTWAGDFHIAKLMNGWEPQDERPGRLLLDSPEEYSDKPEPVVEIHAENFVYEDPDRERFDIGIPEGIEMHAMMPAAKPVVRQKRGGKPLEKVRLDDEMLMDLAFTLMSEGKWSDAADVFLSFRESTRVSWLRKQADVERLNALIHAKRTVEAVDLVFSILGYGYDLSDQERMQIEGVLRGLQGES